jgi:hypothetical protein
MSHALIALMVGCSSDSPTEPPAEFDAAIRVTGVVLWRDCSPAVGVTVKLREHRSYSVCNEIFGCTRYSAWLHDQDVTNADGRYEVAAVVTCPADVRIWAFPDSGSMTSADADPSDNIFCREGDQTVNVAIGSYNPTICFPNP